MSCARWLMLAKCPQSTKNITVISRSITVLRFTRKNGTHTNVTKVFYDEYRNIFASYCVCDVPGPIANENRAVGYFTISLLKICPMERCPVAREKLLSTFLFPALDSFRRSFGTFRAVGENVFPSRWRRKDEKREATWKKTDENQRLSIGHHSPPVARWNLLLDTDLRFHY